MVVGRAGEQPGLRESAHLAGSQYHCEDVMLSGISFLFIVFSFQGWFQLPECL